MVAAERLQLPRFWGCGAGAGAALPRPALPQGLVGAGVDLKLGIKLNVPHGGGLGVEFSTLVIPKPNPCSCSFPLESTRGKDEGLKTNLLQTATG